MSRVVQFMVITSDLAGYEFRNAIYSGHFYSHFFPCDVTHKVCQPCDFQQLQ